MNLDFSRINLKGSLVVVMQPTPRKVQHIKLSEHIFKRSRFAKWSDNQVLLEESQDETHYEMKGSLKLFNKIYKGITLKNFQGNSKKVEKTFEYMFLVDTENIPDWWLRNVFILLPVLQQQKLNLGLYYACYKY